MEEKWGTAFGLVFNVLMLSMCFHLAVFGDTDSAWVIGSMFISGIVGGLACNALLWRTCYPSNPSLLPSFAVQFKRVARGAIGTVGEEALEVLEEQRLRALQSAKLADVRLVKWWYVLVKAVTVAEILWDRAISSISAPANFD